MQWSRAKGFDSFCPLGPWIETDLDPHDFAEGRTVQTHLNGDLKQDGSTKDLIFDIPTLVAYITSAMTLLPGDVILTGTPEGVGPMKVGDEVEVSIAGLGTLTNKVAQRWCSDERRDDRCACGCGSARPRPATRTSAWPGPPCSTGCSRATTAATSSSGSRTPTPRATARSPTSSCSR